MLLPDGFPGWNRAYDQGNAVLNNPEDKLLLDDYFRKEKKVRLMKSHTAYTHTQMKHLFCV